MALQYADPGGEFYFSSGVTAPGIWGTVSAIQLTSSAPAGRTTQYAMQILGSTGDQFGEKILNGNYPEVICSGALYIGNQITNNSIILYMMDGTTTQVDLRINSSGNLFATRNGTTLGSPSSNHFILNQGWTYIEMKVKVNSTTGTVDVLVNGASWLSLSSQNTQASGTAQINKTRYGTVNRLAAGCFWKDMVGVDTGTGVNTTYLGDVAVGVVYPNAAGTNQQWTANGAGTQVGCVQDGINHTGTWPDGDTTYISDGTIGDISDFQHQSVSVTGTIYGVVHYTYARKDDAGSRTIQQVTVQSGSVTENTADIGLGNTYNYYADILEQNPTGPATWTASSFNSTNFGVKVTS